MVDVGSRHLRSFLAVAEELHFGRAALRLGIAQSALSQQVRRLEDAVGAELLTRTSRRVELTPAGSVVRAGAERVLGDLDRVIAQARAAQAGEVGTVLLGAQGAALVPPIVATLAQRSPGLRVEVRESTSEEQAAALLSAALDVGLVREVEPRPGLEVELLLEEPVRAVLPARHRLADRRAIELAELAHEPFVLWRRRGSPGFFDDLTAACRRAGFSPHVAYEMRGIQARLGLVAAGLGVSLEAASYAVASRDDVRFVPLAGTPATARVSLAWAARRPGAARDLVLQVAREVARASGASSARRRPGRAPGGRPSAAG